MAKWIQKQDPYIYCLQKTYFKPRDPYRLEVRGWKKIFHAKGNQKKVEVAILISDKITLKQRQLQEIIIWTLHNDQGINPTRQYDSCK